MSRSTRTFPSLRKIEYEHWHPLNDSKDVDGLPLSIFIQTLGPSIKVACFAVDHEYLQLGAHLALATRSIAEVCKDLAVLQIKFPLRRPVPLPEIEPYFLLMTKLESLTLTPVAPSWDLIQFLSSLPRLRCLHLDFVNNSVNNARAGTGGGRCIQGFQLLERLTLDNAQYADRAIFFTLADSEALRELDVEWVLYPDSPMFPVKFSSKKLESLCVRSYWDHSLVTNILAAIERFSGLRCLHIESENVLAITDLHFESVIRQCPRLETLRLHPDAREYWPRHDINTLSLGCLALILSHCPLLSRIEGCFNLDQSKSRIMIPSHLTTSFGI